MIDEDLEIAFTREAIANARRVEIAGLSRRSRWLAMIGDAGSAKRAWEAQRNGYSTGFADLCMAGHYELTVEYLVLNRKFASLFTRAQRAEAHRLLVDYCKEQFSEDIDDECFLCTD